MRKTLLLTVFTICSSSLLTMGFLKLRQKKKRRKKPTILNGKNLDMIAQSYGLKRKFLESDKKLSKRIVEKVTDV